MNNRPLKSAALLCLAVTLTGCGTSLRPLDYHATQAYVPVTLGLGPANTRHEQFRQGETIAVLKDTGAFSMLDGGYTRNGYSLLITEPWEGGPNYLGMFNVLTLFTFPLPYHYKNNLRSSVFKDGQLLKTYNYSREGWSVATWYAPDTRNNSKRQMLDQLMREMDSDRLIPYSR